jgi:hypothetical protein
MSHYRFPQTRWSFAHFRQLAPTSNIWRGDSPASVLPRALRTDTDAIVVLHKGRIVYERYFGEMKPHTSYMAMSVTKSFFGTLSAMLVPWASSTRTRWSASTSPSSRTAPGATPPCAKSFYEFVQTLK